MRDNASRQSSSRPGLIKALSAAAMVLAVGLFVRALTAQQPRYRSLSTSSPESPVQTPGQQSDAGGTETPIEVEVYSAEADRLIHVPAPSMSDAAWKEVLTHEQYLVLRQKGTERAFSGQYWRHGETGVYRCAACGNDLFPSTTKFDSGTGWPSFWRPVHPANILTEIDQSMSAHRTEVLCAVCGGHLGHLFEDGPEPTGLRYCVNSAALELAPLDLPGEPPR